MHVYFLLLITNAILLIAALFLIASNIRKSERIRRFSRIIEEMEERISIYCDAINDGVCTYDQDQGYIKDYNAVFARWFLRNESGPNNVSVGVCCSTKTPFTLSEFKKNINKASPDRPARFEWSAVTRDDQKLLFLVSVYIMGTENRNKKVLVFHDITAEKEMGGELDHLNNILESIGEGIAIADMEGRITFVNKTWADMHGYSQRDLIGKHIRIFHSDKQFKQEVEPFIEMVVRKGIYSGEVGHMHADGTEFPTHMTTSIIKDHEGVPIGFTTIAADLSEQKKVEAALRASEIKFRQLFNLMPEPIAFSDLPGRFFDVNDEFCKLCGYSRHETLGKTALELGFDPDRHQEFINSVTKNGEVNGFETEIKAKDGNRFTVLLFARMIEVQDRFFILTVLHDVTEQRRLESRLAEAEKLEAIGTLAGGIAHDFNNILSAILGYVELCLLKTEPGSKISSHLNGILKATNRAQDLIKRILAVSRHAAQPEKPIHIESIVEDVLGLMRASLPSRIEIKHEQSGPCGRIKADPGQIHQLLMNLCTNAGQSMEEEGGTLFVGIDEVDIRPEAFQPVDSLAPGPYLRITVRDSGHGIEPDILKKIFDPYFTTRPKGNGTGLGLSVVQGIARKYKGAVTVSSRPGAGSTFCVYLPVCDHDEIFEKVSKKASGDDLPLGHETILIADDESAIVETGGELLSRLGYKVETVLKGGDAIALFEENPDRFDLVISDMTMPDMTGDDLAARLIGIRPGLPVILCTGYTTRMDENTARKKGIKAFLYKPVSISLLARTIRDVLDSGQA